MKRVVLALLFLVAGCWNGNDCASRAFWKGLM